MSAFAASSPSTEAPTVLARGLRTLALCLLFVASVAWTSATPIGTPSLWKTLGQALAAGAVVHLLGRGLQRRWPATFALVILTIGIGCWRTGAILESASEPWSEAPRLPIRAHATVDGPVETRGEVAHVYVGISRIDRPEGLAPPAGRVQLTVPALSLLQAGDLIEIVGRVEPVDGSNPFGRTLLGQGVVATARFPDVLPIGRADEPPLALTIRRLRSTLQETTEHMLPQPHASLVAGLLLGTTNMSDAFRLALIASGTSHIVVVSGYNITVVGGILASLFRGHRSLALLLPLVGVWGFTLFVGATGPAVRAAIMATMYLLAGATGRRADALTALGLASALMCAVDPTLAGNLSFQLSAISTLGLIVLYPRLAKLARWLPPWLRDPIATSLAASLATAPILTSTFHQVSLATPLANALVEPLVPVITIAAAIGVPLAATVPPLAALVGALLVVPAHAVVTAIELCAALPSAIIPAGEMPAPVLVAFVLGLVAWAASATPEGHDIIDALRASSRLRALAPAALVGLSAMLVAWSSVGLAPPPLVLDVLDVGQGDAIFIRTPAGHSVLIDGGPNPSALLQQIGRRMGLFEQNLSVVILTQADQERLPGALAALERYAPGLVIGPPEGSTSGLYERWKAGIARTEIIGTPTTVDIEPGVALELAPTTPVPGLGRGGGAPRRALVVRVVHGEVAVLIAPTVTAAATQQAAAGLSLRAAGLYVPRHGETGGLTSALLSAIDPQVAVLSVGARNRDDLPSRATLDLLATIPTHRTDLHGTIELRSDGTQLTVTRDRDPR